MKNFIIANWFKLALLALLIVGLVIFGFYFIQKNKLESERVNQEMVIREVQETKKLITEEKENLISTCISDAYVELKTLQGNYDAIKFKNCAESNCNIDFWDKAKKEALSTYEQEWVPQCKLGNRVFIHYEPYKF